jgi:hypothetical protein
VPSFSVALLEFSPTNGSNTASRLAMPGPVSFTSRRSIREPANRQCVVAHEHTSLAARHATSHCEHAPFVLPRTSLSLTSTEPSSVYLHALESRLSRHIVSTLSSAARRNGNARWVKNRVAYPLCSLRKPYRCG